MNDMLYIWVAVFAILAHILYVQHRNKLETEKWVRLVLAIGDLKVYRSPEAVKMATATAYNDEQIFAMHYRSGGYVDKLTFHIGIATKAINHVEPKYVLEAVNRFCQTLDTGVTVYKLEPYVIQTAGISRPSSVAMS